MVKTPRVVITPGEPAGIGPDLVVALAQNSWPAQLVVCADPSLLTARAAQLGLPLTLLPFSSDKPAAPQAAGTLTLLPVTLKAPVVPVRSMRRTAVTWWKPWRAPAMAA